MERIFSMFPPNADDEPMYPLHPTQQTHRPHPQQPRAQGAVPIAGVDDSPLFDGVAYTQGNMPHLLEFLRAAYRRYLQEKIEQRRALGQQTISLDEAMTTAPYTSFFNFCVRYLTVNRPVESFHVDMNHGIKLSNHVRVVVCPGTNPQGTMQDSGAVAVTHGKSQPGLDGVYRGGEINI